MIVKFEDPTLPASKIFIPVGKKLKLRFKGRPKIDDCRPRVLSYTEHMKKQRNDDYRRRRGW